MSDKLPLGILELGLGSGYPGGPVSKDLEPFTRPIFFGHDSCEGELLRAHGQLDIAFSHVSGLQQPCHCSRPCGCSEDDEKGWEQVRALARSLVTALGVPDILKTEAPTDQAVQIETLTKRVHELEDALRGAVWHAQDIVSTLQKV